MRAKIRLKSQESVRTWCRMSLQTSIYLGCTLTLCLLCPLVYLNNSSEESSPPMSDSEYALAYLSTRSQGGLVSSTSDRHELVTNTRSRVDLESSDSEFPQSNVIVDLSTSKHHSKPLPRRELYVNGIFWPSSIESQMPKGFDQKDDFEWINSWSAAKVVGEHTGCGRMQNRLLTLSSGESVCARYRKNADQIRGEYFSFLLARLLGMGNVVPSSLVIYRGAERGNAKWSGVSSELGAAQWERKPIVLTKHIDGLVAASIPHVLRSTRRRLDPHSITNATRSTSDLIELVQWSDLIIFDYLIANTDRMINNMINEHWNPHMMDGPAHNLMRHNQTNLLLFLDNESGMLHGYRLLKKYEPMHRSLLDMLCIFRRSTVARLRQMARLSVNDLTKLLSRHFVRYAPSYNSTELGFQWHILPHNNAAILLGRIGHVVRQVDQCRHRFTPHTPSSV